jgi:NAD(P)-dependent dehydrogenase (short-subunit alcohol dehydrogenase family)
VSSIHARAAFPGYALYDTCKGAVESLTRYVCVEYGHLGIRCNAVAPGAVLTPAAVRLSEATDDPDAAFAATRDLSPMHRISDPKEIADVVAFLLSPEAIAINGHVLAVDNGMAARAYGFAPAPGIKFGADGVDE